MSQKYTYILGGLLALHLGSSAWSKTFCENKCESGGGIWCQLDFIHKECQRICDASKLGACNQQNLNAQANKAKLKEVLGVLKNNFCKFGCSASDCKDEVFGAFCVKSCSDIARAS